MSVIIHNLIREKALWKGIACTLFEKGFERFKRSQATLPVSQGPNNGQTKEELEQKLERAAEVNAILRNICLVLLENKPEKVKHFWEEDLFLLYPAFNWPVP